MFPTDLTAALTGASRAQLRRWSQTKLLVPEVATHPRLLYSFRDIVALRTVVRMRADTSLQRIRTAFVNMPALDLTEHPSRYRFGTDGGTVVLINDEDSRVDLVQTPGQYHFVSLAEIFESFATHRGNRVVNFLRPREALEVRAGRMGGWPTIADTRVPYDTVASLVAGGDVPAEQVTCYYPGVSADAACDAIDFDESVRRTV